MHEALGPRATLLREPGGTEAGERLRELLKDPATALDPRTELLMFCAARAELCASVVEAAIAAGRDVICDRFIDSTVAYQGVARGLGPEIVERINEFAIGPCVPDLTVYLRIEPDEAARRGQQRLAAGVRDGTDRFEAEGPEFQRLVAAAYDELAERHPERIVTLDGAGAPEDVHASVLELVRARR